MDGCVRTESAILALLRGFRYRSSYGIDFDKSEVTSLAGIN